MRIPLRSLVMTAFVASAALLTSAAVAQDKGSPAQPAQPSKPAAPATPQTPAKPATPAPAKPETPPAAKPEEKPAVAGPALEYVKMTTSLGDMVIELNREKAPISVENFLHYVDKDFYAGTIFHRIGPANNAIIQGGGFTADLTQKTTDKPIKNEWNNGLKNVAGSIAMARTPQPDSATSQFFINLADNSYLDRADQRGAAYAVFGRIVAGMDVARQIKAVPTGKATAKPLQGPPMTMSDVPLQPVTINKVVRISADEAKKLMK